jgi:P4 family phage/plasmid primase-like protien
MASEIVFGAQSAGGEDFKQAEWLAEKLGGAWRYDFTAKQWHHFDGVRWAMDSTGQVMRTVATAAANTLKVGVNDVALQKALLRLFNIASVNKALEALATLDGYGTDGSDWDQDINLLGTKSGIVDLRYNRLIKATPDQLVTRSTGTVFEPISGPEDFRRVAPEFMEFLLEVTSDYDETPDVGQASYILLWFGASLFGFTPEQRFLLMTGGGGNGKGALRHAIMQAVGEYAHMADSNMYSRSKFGPARSDGPRADLIKLKGKRIVFCSEPDKGQFNEEMLKAHTGGDIITARDLFSRASQQISWEPTHSITFLVNDAPSIEDIGSSMVRRLMVADFRHHYEGKNEDKEMYGYPDAKLDREKSGILSILCWSAKAWYDQWKGGHGGLELPARVIEQSKQFIERNDPISEALREAFEFSAEFSCAGLVAYRTYQEWHARSGQDGEPLSNPKFAEALIKRNFHKDRTMKSVIWRGLKPLSAVKLAEREGDESDEDDA